MVEKDENPHDQSPEALYQREVREHYATLINSIPIGVYLFLSSPAKGMRFDFVSPKFCEILNMSEEEIREDPARPFNAAHPEDYQSLIEANQFAVNNGQVFSWEGRFVIDGRVKWVEINSEPKRLSNGDILWSGLIREITERKQAEAKVLFERAQAQQYLDIAAVMIVALDERGNVTLINRKGCEVLGYDDEAELIGKDWFDHCIPGDIRATIREVFQQIISGDVAAVENYENELLTRSGEKVTLSFYNALVRDEQGRIKGIISSGENVTEQRRLEAQFNQAQKMEAVGTLVGGIAHDFNNMLAGITGNTYLAIENARAGELADVMARLKSIEALSYRAADMVQQLLTFARKGNVQMKPLVLEPFIREIMRFIRSTTPENIQLSLESSGEAMTIEGDETMFHQVLMNLINNARDAVEGVASPLIRLKLERCRLEAGGELLKRKPHAKPGSYAHLQIADNGCGIAGERIPRLFEPFFTTKEQGKGTGLGLAMVFGAIKSHHGFIEVESLPGEGATFHLYVPLLAGEERQTEPATAAVQRGQGETILFVDDNVSVRKSSKAILENLGYRVMEAGDGVEAVALFNRHQLEIDLLIIDVVMPRLGGVEAAEQMRRIRPDIKVIYSTGYDKEEALKGKSLGKDIVLSKPYNIRDLSLSIREQFN